MKHNIEYILKFIKHKYRVHFKVYETQVYSTYQSLWNTSREYILEFTKHNYRVHIKFYETQV